MKFSCAKVLKNAQKKSEIFDLAVIIMGFQLFMFYLIPMRIVIAGLGVLIFMID